MAISGNRRSLPVPLLFALAPLIGGGCSPPNPTLSMSPTAWDFGTLAPGSQASQTVTLTNTSGYALHVLDDGQLEDRQLSITGLPIANLEPGHSAEIELVLRAEIPTVNGFSTTVQLAIGGHAGGSLGNSNEGVVSFEVSGSITSVSAQVCSPGPDGNVTAFGGIAPYALAEWSQQSYACASLAAPDAGTICQSPGDCPAFCCACASDCASFTAQACVLGTCAPAPVACDLAQYASARGPALCPDGGLPPSSVLGGLGFGVGASGIGKGFIPTIVLAREPTGVCQGAGTPLGLSFFLASQTSSIQAGFLPIGDSATSALLQDPTQGQLNATGGYVLLTTVNASSVAGSFDVIFPGAEGEVWGAIDATHCP